MRKQILTLAALLGLILPVQGGALVTTIVTDPISGVAIDGYDPVSYFIGPEPQMGKPDFEYYWGGVPWYFANPGNRDAFARAPEFYAPQYGGHCVTSLSRGYLSDGKPRLYVVEALKLYFFYSTGNREAFLMSRTATLEAAITKWPDLAQGLVGVAGSKAVDPAMAVADPGAVVAPEAAAASVESH